MYKGTKRSVGGLCAERRLLHAYYYVGHTGRVLRAKNDYYYIGVIKMMMLLLLRHPLPPPERITKLREIRHCHPLFLTPL